MASILADFWNLVFPRTCLGCRERILLEGEQNLCTYCRSRLPQTDHHLFPSANALYDKLAAFVPLRAGMAYLLFTKSGRAQQLLHSIKYRNLPELAEELGSWHGGLLAEVAYQQRLDALVPVPLHEKRLRQRGYNQSHHIALGLGRVLGLPVWQGVVERHLPSSTQTRKSRLQRWQNVEEIFRVVAPETVQGCRLALVDDIITTGATTAACGMALLEAGCAELDCLALATAQ
ncbi:ComF family protein [Cesiribacter andamanensis]|uniref:DNA utilization protein GntX n=1 Tax=Cesiribacter andamanensis AMV16 TaxID=1279009 RepID=M7N6P0_9BACT|nr:ComF family protein [Cesiribacter andamanensis]EMR02896.1 DNA utilization protein GntX [Cesiribacter andamanensis AMV16]